MPLTQADRVKGGKTVAQLKGREYMSKIGKRGRKKQLKALRRIIDST